jgi:hypothetical protein
LLKRQIQNQLRRLLRHLPQQAESRYVVDLTALFDATAATIDDYVHYDEGTQTLSVDVDGASGAAGFEDVAVFQNNPAAATITLLYDDGTNNHTVQADTIP